MDNLWIWLIYPLVNKQLAIENCPVSLSSYIWTIVIFHDYVSLPEGKSFNQHGNCDMFQDIYTHISLKAKRTRFWMFAEHDRQYMTWERVKIDINRLYPRMSQGFSRKKHLVWTEVDCTASPGNPPQAHRHIDLFLSLLDLRWTPKTKPRKKTNKHCL